MRFLLKFLKWLLLGLLLLIVALRIVAWSREGPVSPPASISMVDTRFGKVAVQLSGPEDGPRVILLHGTAAWSGFWKDITAHLASNGWRVIAVDTPPFGWSERDPRARYDRVSQAQRLDDVLNATGGKALVVGHSFGAGAAVELALRSPEMVDGLVLVDAALGKLNPPADSGKGTVATGLSFGPIGQAVTSATITNPMMTGTLLRSFIARKEAAQPWLDVLEQPMRRSGSTTAYAQWLPQLFVANDNALSRERSNLSAIDVPVAIIWGEADTVTPPAQGRELQKLLRAVSTIWLPGVGHIPHIEDPKAFTAALDRSLSALHREE